MCLFEPFTHSSLSLDVTIAIPQFSGRSYIAYPSLTNTFATTNLLVEVRPNASNGLILLNRQLVGGYDYISIALRNGRAEFRFNLGSGTALLTSTNTLTLGEWHVIEASRNGPNGRLIVDGTLPVTGSSLGSFTGLQLGDNLYLGGVPDYTILPAGLSVSSGLVGCVRQLNHSSMSLNLIGAAVDDSDITPCTGVSPCSAQPCLNGGTCSEEQSNGFSCQCALGWGGQLCETVNTQCLGDNPCENAGVCMVRLVEGVGEQYCDCSLPYGGANCSESESHTHTHTHTHTRSHCPL